MHRFTLSIGLALVSFVLGTSMVDAQDACSRLWVQRNAIYKANGYCFKTERAIRRFGNARCQYDEEADVPLSRSERARIARIIDEERSRGCR